MNQMMKFLRDEEGASAVEYGLIIGLIAVAIIVVLGSMGNGLNGLFTKAENKISDAGK